MRPEDTKLNSEPRGGIQPPSRSHTPAHTAVANIALEQIDSIYNDQAIKDAAEEQAPAVHSDQNPYNRTHEPAHTTQAKQWQHYHSAWQDYYQKYYEHYYMGAVTQVHQAYTEKASELQQNTPSTLNDAVEETISSDEALYDLRNQIVNKVHESGKKVRKSRHFVPIIAALGVLLLFAGLQYNRLIIANVKAYVTPGEIDPQNIVVDPSASLAVSDKPLLIIPKINVNVPVDYNAKSDQASQLKSMENGAAYFGIPGANSKPGQIGNTVISGHSSNDYIDTGNYKFIFVQLERLKKGDTFYLHYKGIRYTYTITRTQTVSPTNVKALVYRTTKPVVTLITCTPVGTALNRFLVTAEQVSPSPSAAKAAPTNTKSTDEVAIPGNSPTLFERLLGQ